MKKQLVIIKFLFCWQVVAFGQEVDINLLSYPTDESTYFFGTFDKPFWSVCTSDGTLFTRDTLVFTANLPRCEDTFVVFLKKKRIIAIRGTSRKFKNAEGIYSKWLGIKKRVKFYRRKKNWYLKLAVDKKEIRKYKLIELSKKSLGVSERTGEERFSYKMIFVYESAMK